MRPLDQRRPSRRLAPWLLLLSAPVIATQGSGAWIPLTDLVSPYLGAGEPGLYPGGANVPTGEHLAYGLLRAGNVTPRDATGASSPDGLVGVVALGMSNANQEWSRFERESDHLGGHAARVVLVDAAQGGTDALEMSDPLHSYWSLFDNRLTAAGVDPLQVQVAWIKQSIEGEVTSGSFPERTEALRDALATITGILAARCPNLQLIFLSSRIWSTNPARNTFTYESGFSVKGLIALQVADLGGSPGGLGSGPWLGWGPYLWAEGSIPRSDGLTWDAWDLSDGVHPSLPGEWTVATMLDRHFRENPLAASWFAPPDDAAMIALDASDDAQVDPAAPDTNFGLQDRLRLENNQRVYLRFDLAGLDAPVLRAKLSLLVDEDEAVNPLAVYAIPDTGWSETTLTWNNAPPLPPAAIAQAPAASPGASWSFDVTTEVQAAIAQGAVSLAVAVPMVSAVPGSFLSRQTVDPPRLILTVDRPGDPAPIFVDAFETADFWPWL
ncbi:MAG: DNRLRE domain-containing protein [Thermoanaerobaculia bacterium]